MPSSRVSLNVLLIFYSVNIFTLNTGHCQFPGRRLGVTRTRFREQHIPLRYRPSQQWGGRSPFSINRYNNRAAISNYLGDLDRPYRFRNIRYHRGRETYSHVPYNEQNRGISSRTYRPSVDTNRDNRFFDRSRYSTFRSRGGRVYDQSPNVVPVNTQNERYRYSTHGSVDTSRNYPRSATRRFSPYSSELTLDGMSSSRDRTMSLHQGRSGSYRPAYNTPTKRVSPEQTYQTSNGNQLSGRYNPPTRRLSPEQTYQTSNGNQLSGLYNPPTRRLSPEQTYQTSNGNQFSGRYDPPTRRLSPEQTYVTSNGNQFSGRYNPQTRRLSPEQTYQTSNRNRLGGRSVLSHRYQSPTNGFVNYSPMSKNGENVNQYQLSTPEVATSPMLRAERNEVFQYRTSVMRAPQSDLSGSRDHVDRQRFSGYPVQSLSLPFEPLSLRYQGFRDSKRAGQQEILSDRTTNVNRRITEQNRDTGTLRTSVPLERSSDTEVIDRATNFDTGSTNGVVNTEIYQPVVGSVREQMLPERTTNFVSRNTNGNARIFQPDIPVQGRLVSDRATNIADRNRALVGNTRTLFSGVQSGKLYDRTTSLNERRAGQNHHHRNNQPGTRFQKRLGQTRAFDNDVRFRNLQQNGDQRRFRQNNAYTNRNVPGGSLHEIFGISRAGLEGALKQDQSLKGANTGPVSNNFQVVEGNQRPKQLIGVQNAVLDNNTNTVDQLENRANLIADITKDMDIVDRINLLRNRHIKNNNQTNILTVRPVSSDNNNGRRIIILTRRPTNNGAQSTNPVISRTILHQEDSSVDDIEDDFAGGPASIDDNDKSSIQRDTLIRDSRRNLIESDEEVENNSHVK